MRTNAELMSEFSRCRQLGLLTDDEYLILTRYLSPVNGGEAPAWVREFADVCSQAFSGRMSQAEFNGLKDSFFQNIEAGKKTVVHDGAIPVHPLGVDADAEAQARRVVKNCAMVAAFIGLIPLPVADAPFLIVTQYVMLKSLCAKYGRSPGASLVLIVLSALLGPVVFNAFVKRLPLAGSILGATIAGGFTWYIGAKVRFMLANAQDFTLDNFLRAKASW